MPQVYFAEINIQALLQGSIRRIAETLDRVSRPKFTGIEKRGFNVVESNVVRVDLSISERVEWTSDTSLVKRAKEGDFAAFEQLFERHRTLVYRFAYQMTFSRDDSEDMVQEAFIRAYQNLNRYRDEAKFTTWILRIVSNLCTDRARSSQRRKVLEHQEAGAGLDWMTLGNPDDPVGNLEDERRKVVLRKALGALPTHHRMMIVLRDLEEKEYPEIAQTLGCTVGGAKLRVLRARRALKDRLAPLLEDRQPV